MSGKSNAVDKVKAAEDSVKLIDSESEGESVHAELNVSEELTKVKSSVETRRASKSLRKTRGSVRAAALSAELLTADTEGEMPEAGSPPLMKIKRERKEKIVDDVDVEIHNEELDIDMGEETDDADEACFKIDKVYSVAEEQDSGEPSEETGNVNESGEKKLPKLKLIADVTRKDEKKQLKEELKKLKEEKQLKAGKGGRATIAKVPSLAGGVSGVRGGVSGVRMLPGGVRAATMPLIVSMGGGNPSIPLLPAGLPPGRYVILPGTTSSATKTTTVTTMASSLSPRLASGVSSGAGPSVAVVPSKTLATPTNTPPALPHHAGGTKLYTRERGRRKSYTAGEKLAMIEAVEGGQRKSAVADRFGVAPSTLACILAQKHKIRSEQDNLARRRVRHGRGYGVRESAKTPPSAPDTPFTHFLAPLAAPSSAVLDTQPEEIIAIPDLVERMGGGGGGGGGSKTEATSETEDEDPHPPPASPSILLETEPIIETEYLHESKSAGLHQQARRHLRHQLHEAGEEPLGQDTSGSASPPSAANAGLTGPYLLKKETHCTTVLDQLMRDDTYADVTLTAEGQSLRAHRIVLCLASSYFRQVLSRDMNVQSVIVLRDIKFAELRNIIHFIYTGEATVDASELESFMRTAELLEITSLCESQKCLTGRGNLPHNSFSSSFSIGDFEQLVGTKRSKKEQSSSPKKARRISGEGQSSSRCSSVEPAPTPNPIALIKEEPGYEPPAKVIKKQEKESLDKELLNTEPTNEGPSCTERLRRDSSGSVGSFAAIAGIQKTTGDADEGGEGYSADGLTSSNSQEESMRRESPMAPLADTTAQPKRCPYCPHLSQTYEGVDMMRHLLVSHPCKPAFPCDVCCRVFVKRASYKAHQPHCHQSMT